MNIAIIIARLGSVRLKNKNIKNFYGKPIISYPIRTLIRSGIFSKVYVSTESKKIAKIASSYGASIPFLRSKSLANNHTSTLKVVKNFIYRSKISSKTNVCCVYPTTPLLSSSLLNKSLKKFLRSRKTFLVPIQKANKSEKKTFQINEKQEIIKKNKSNTYFKDPGQFYYGTAETFLKKKSILFSGNSKTIIIPQKSALDVNRINDWKLLEKIFKKNKKND